MRFKVTKDSHLCVNIFVSLYPCELFLFCSHGHSSDEYDRVEYGVVNTINVLRNVFNTLNIFYPYFISQLYILNYTIFFSYFHEDTKFCYYRWPEREEKMCECQGKVCVVISIHLHQGIQIQNTKTGFHWFQIWAKCY